MNPPRDCRGYLKLWGLVNRKPQLGPMASWAGKLVCVSTVLYGVVRPSATTLSAGSRLQVQQPLSLDVGQVVQGCGALEAAAGRDHFALCEVEVKRAEEVEHGCRGLAV